MIDNNNTGGSFRVKRNPFTQVSNSALRDNNLSLKGKGLYSLIQSYITIPNFILYKGHLMSICKEKVKAFNSAWKELKDNGYLKQYRIPKGKNDSFVYEYELLDIADPTTPSLVNLNKHGEVIANDEENHEQIHENSHTPQKGYHATSTIPKRDSMPNVPYAKRGGYSNTDLDLDLKKEDFKENYTKFKSVMSVVENDEIKKNQTDTTIDVDTEIRDEDKVTHNYSTTQTKTQTKISKPIFSAESQNKVEKASNPNEYEIYKQIIQENISYEGFLTFNPSTTGKAMWVRGEAIELVDEIIECMLDVILTKGATVKIKDEYKSRDMVKSVYLKLNSKDIEQVMYKFRQQADKITHVDKYLKSMLYTINQERSHHNINNYGL